jgi:hypothetical protein
MHHVFTIRKREQQKETVARKVFYNLLFQKLRMKKNFSTSKNTQAYNTHGPSTVVGIATGYGMDGPEIESR